MRVVLERGRWNRQNSYKEVATKLCYLLPSSTRHSSFKPKLCCLHMPGRSDLIHLRSSWHAAFSSRMPDILLHPLPFPSACRRRQRGETSNTTTNNNKKEVKLGKYAVLANFNISDVNNMYRIAYATSED